MEKEGGRERGGAKGTEDPSLENVPKDTPESAPSDLRKTSKAWPQKQRQHQGTYFTPGKDFKGTAPGRRGHVFFRWALPLSAWMVNAVWGEHGCYSTRPVTMALISV